jgi:GH25 family lysozyme M1 (1,4-beta-N-acetylmuramidase)
MPRTANDCVTGMLSARVILAGLAAWAAFFVAARASALINGIDVSHWQGSINWTSVRNDGVKFAFVKVADGVGDYDETYPTNLGGAIAAGIPVGPYHYAYPYTNNVNAEVDARNEANYFASLIHPYYQNSGVLLRPVLDIEAKANVGTTAQEKVYLSQWVRTFQTTIHDRLGVYPLIYTYSSFASTYFESDLSQYDLWIANYNYTPPTTPPASQYLPWSDWDFWQHSSTGSIAGISGNVDLDVFDGTLLELAQQFSPNYSHGDYNNNQFVDTADYILWRNSFGQPVNPGTGADGDLSGVIDAGDFAIWKSNFGKSVPNIQYVPPAAAAAFSTAIVPEPSTAVLVLLAAGGSVVRRRGALARSQP